MKLRPRGQHCKRMINAKREDLTDTFTTQPCHYLNSV